MDKAKILARLNRRTIKIAGCWLWKGYRDWDGYGRITIAKKTFRVNRLSAWLHLNLDLDDPSQQATHKCPNKNCWNPDHLYVGTAKSNSLDSVRDGTHYESTVTHCPRNHEYTKENTFKHNGKRQCQICRRENSIRLHLKQKELLQKAYDRSVANRSSNN